MISFNPFNPWDNARNPVPGAMIPILHMKTLEQREVVSPAQNISAHKLLGQD